ncbi:RNase H domain-containing protein [Trichonephila clavipes]|nr:RNase H domain-containing protein [Trichonephila clavipes]
MSALESLHFLTERRHPCNIKILLLLRKLEKKVFDIIFSWLPGHVGILGNEQANNAARSMSDPMQQPVCYQDLKTSIQHYIHHIWQETWDPQILNKLHSIHPSTSHWAVLPVRVHDVHLTRLRLVILVLRTGTFCWFDRGRVVAYRDCGLTFRKIGSRVGRNQTTVMRVCDRWMPEGTTDHRGRSHSPQCTTSCVDRKILCIAVTDRSVAS